METLVIDRTRWLRGEGDDDSKLLRSSDNRLCCLGFDMLRRGYTEEQIQNVGTPEDLEDIFQGLTKTGGMDDDDGRIDNTPLCEELMVANDSKAIDETAREVTIKKLFAELDIEVVFVN